MRCLLLLSQTSICHPRASVTAVDEQCSQVVDLLQQTRRGWIRADNVGWKGVFGLPGLIHQSNTLR